MQKFRIEKRFWKISDNNHKYYKYAVQVKTFWGWRYLKYLSTMNKYTIDNYQSDSPYTMFTSRLECINLIEQYKAEKINKKPIYEYIK
jgi:hypothetical protein